MTRLIVMCVGVVVGHAICQLIDSKIKAQEFNWKEFVDASWWTCVGLVLYHYI